MALVTYSFTPVIKNKKLSTFKDVNLWLHPDSVDLRVTYPGRLRLFGVRRSLATASGDLTANVLQMIVASLGLASLIAKAQLFFVFVKWAGVIYLVYLGLQLLCSRGNNKGDDCQQKSLKSLYLQGVFTSAANPKAVVFFAALFPQFINTAEPLFTQFVVLSLTYLTIDGLFLTCYGKFATALNGQMEGSFANSRVNYIGGLLLIGAAILLCFKEVEQGSRNIGPHLP